MCKDYSVSKDYGKLKFLLIGHWLNNSWQSIQRNSMHQNGSLFYVLMESTASCIIV